MKRVLFFLCIWMVMFPMELSAQQADGRIGELINQTDWFTLEKEFPKVKEELKVPIVRWLAESLLGVFFNRPQEAISAIDTLLIRYQNDLGFDNISNMIIYQSNMFGERGKYSEAADRLNSFLDQVTVFTEKENFPYHVALAKYYDEIRNEKKPEIVRLGDKDTEIPMTIEKAGRGVLMFVPVTVNGKEHKFIFDTGAGSTFLSQRFAKELGVRIVRDSVLIKGVEQAYGQSGIIDSMMIGDILFKNSIVTIAFPDTEVDTVYQVDAVLGADFMRLVGEVNVYPQDGKIVFPVDKTPTPATGRNMMLNDRITYLEAFSKNQRLIMLFDTGNVRGDLFRPYYDKNEEYVNNNSRKDTIRSGGFGGVRSHEVLVLDSIPLQIGNTVFDLKHVAVNPGNAMFMQTGEDGALGMDFVRTFRKITISFDNMFTEVEL